MLYECWTQIQLKHRFDIKKTQEISAVQKVGDCAIVDAAHRVDTAIKAKTDLQLSDQRYYCVETRTDEISSLFHY